MCREIRFSAADGLPEHLHPVLLLRANDLAFGATSELGQIRPGLAKVSPGVVWGLPAVGWRLQ